MSAASVSERAVAAANAAAGGAAFAEAESTAATVDSGIGVPGSPGSASAERSFGAAAPKEPSAGDPGEREGAEAPSRKAAPQCAPAEIGAERSYSADEVRALVQSEADRRVTGAKKRWERELGERIEGEAKRLAEELTAQYGERIAVLEGELAAEREAGARRERRLAIDAALAAAGLPAALAPLVEGVGAGGESEAIAAIKSAVAERALAECAKRIGTTAPAAGETKRSLTENEIRALPVARLAELMKGQ